MKSAENINKRRRQAGVALLTVLFILALLTTLAVYMVEDQYLALRRVGNLYDGEQALQMAMGSERWAVRVLERDLKETKTDHLNESWNNLGTGVAVEEGALETAVEDAQGRFNLNNLRSMLVGGKGKPNTAWYDAFKRLLLLLELEEGLADAVVDWIDADQQVRGTMGAEDNDYLAREPSYRSADRMFTETSELLLVKGFDEEKLAKIAPYVVALPQENVPINVNTCSLMMLRILAKNPLSEDVAASLALGRTEEGYPSVKEFLTRSELAGEGGTAKPLVSVSSDYFRIDSRAKYGRITLNLTSLAHRLTSSGKADILLRRRGLL